MKFRITALAVACLLVCLGVAVPAAQAQGNCSMATFAGTYAFYDRGSSTIGNLAVQPYPFHWQEAVAPFIAVGEVTFTPMGTGNGFYWIKLGTFNGPLDPIAVEVTITEMNPDCTGKFTYSLNLPGVPVATVIEERFILFDNGREYRSVPTSIVNGIPTLAWLGEGHRIRKFGEPVNTCGLQPVRGNYLITAENVVTPDMTTTFSDTILFRLEISMTGDYTGMLYEKLGPVSPIELPVWGTFTVNPDCSYAWALNVVGIPGTIAVRGVVFNEGKESYGLAMDPAGIKYSFAQGVRIGQ